MGPDLLAGVELWTVGWDVEQVYVFGDLDVLYRVETCVVDDDHFVLPRPVLGKCSQVLMENFFIHSVDLPHERTPIQGRITPEKIGVAEPVLVTNHGPHALCCHTAAEVGH